MSKAIVKAIRYERWLEKDGLTCTASAIEEGWKITTQELDAAIASSNNHLKRIGLLGLTVECKPKR